MPWMSKTSKASNYGSLYDRTYGHVESTLWMTEAKILSVPLTACLFHLDTSSVDIFHCANVYCHS